MDIINVMVLYQSVLHERYVRKSEDAIKCQAIENQMPLFAQSFKCRHKVFMTFTYLTPKLGIYELMLGEDNQADQARAMQQQMPGGGGGQIMDEQKAFKAEWEALKVADYRNSLANIEKTVLKM